MNPQPETHNHCSIHRKILLVDDEPFNILSFEIILN